MCGPPTIFKALTALSNFPIKHRKKPEFDFSGRSKRRKKRLDYNSLAMPVLVPSAKLYAIEIPYTMKYRQALCISDIEEANIKPFHISDSLYLRYLT